MEEQLGPSTQKSPRADTSPLLPPSLLAAPTHPAHLSYIQRAPQLSMSMTHPVDLAIAGLIRSWWRKHNMHSWSSILSIIRGKKKKENFGYQETTGQRPSIGIESYVGGISGPAAKRPASR